MNRRGVGLVLTLAYCRVSTEEQAAEGFSIEGQADRLRAYSASRDLGDVTVISDPGLSGKDMHRPGLQQVLAAVEAGHVSHLLVWRLDRLSRNLGDLILLADMLGVHGVALHSVSENLDLSSAAGRMFYNVLGTFAQFFREQLSENVRMGNDRAVREGKWINRPKTGYDMVDGALVPNDQSTTIREIFRLRADGESYREIEGRTGIKYSTVRSILSSRIYVGEVLHNETWSPGAHEPLVSEAEWQAANRGHVPGRRRSKDILSGKVRCGTCGRRMALDQNGAGRVFYRCKHRGQGCKQPARTTSGLAEAAVLGLRLVSTDRDLQEAIRRKLSGGGRETSARTSRRTRKAPAEVMRDLSERRRKLLDLFYNSKISMDLFEEEEQRLTLSIEGARSQASAESEEAATRSELDQHFERVAAALRNLDVDEVWREATDQERRILIEELLEWVTVFPDHLEVTVVGTPPLAVAYGEVGLKESQIVGVGGPTGNLGPRPVVMESGWSELRNVA